jgi:isopentenyl phosphate kinase
LVNWEYIKKDVMGSKGIDMTGGMLHKVEESMEIATKYGVKTQIISGKVKGRLLKVLKNEDAMGTVIV